MVNELTKRRPVRITEHQTNIFEIDGAAMVVLRPATKHVSPVKNNRPFRATCRRNYQQQDNAILVTTAAAVTSKSVAKLKNNTARTLNRHRPVLNNP